MFDFASALAVGAQRLRHYFPLKPPGRLSQQSPARKTSAMESGFQHPCNPQAESPLFNGQIPGEIRDRILAFALSCSESSKAWDQDSSYVRPEYSAPQVADTSILRTCQLAYAQNWFRPWVSAVHTFYLAWEGRRPDAATTVDEFQSTLDTLFAAHGEVEICHVRVFAQLVYLETGYRVSEILEMRHFFPQKITVCIRHHDWWGWEDDNRLEIGSTWVDQCRFPHTVGEVCMELESVRRKSDQVDWVAEEMVRGWHLQRADGTILSARREDVRAHLWSGSSTWEGERWVRDETQPGSIEYYVKTITWRPNPSLAERPEPDDIFVPDSFPVISHDAPSVPSPSGDEE